MPAASASRVNDWTCPFLPVWNCDVTKDIQDSNPYVSPAHTGLGWGSGQVTTRSALIVAGFIVAAVSNGGAVGVMLTLLSIESGAAIRPMGHAAVVGMFAALGLFVGAPLFLGGTFLVAGWRRGIAILGILLNLAPLPFGSLTLHLVAQWVGFTLQE